MVEKHGAVVRSCFQILNFQNLVACLSLHSEDDTRVFACRRLNLIDIEFLQHLLTRGGLLTLSHIGREAAYKLFQFFALLLGFGFLVLSLTQGQLRALVPERIVSGEEGHLAEVYIYGVSADGIEEVSVVGNHEDGAVVVL